MILVEMKLAGEVEGSVMVHMQMISEVEEMGTDVRLFMASGNSYVVKGETFAAAVNQIEGIHYLKLKTPEEIEAEAAAEAEAVEPAKEVEGELVTECCPA